MGYNHSHVFDILRKQGYAFRLSLKATQPTRVHETVSVNVIVNKFVRSPVRDSFTHITIYKFNNEN